MTPDLITDVILNFIYLLIIGFFLTTLIIYRIKLKKVFTYLILAIFIAFISQILYIIALFNISIAPFDSELLNYFLLFMVIFFAYFHYDEISTHKPSHFRNYLMIGSGMICATLLFIASVNLLESPEIMIPIIDHLSNLYVIVIFIFPLSVLLKSRSIVKERAPLIELLSLILIEISNLVYFIINILVMWGISAESAGYQLIAEISNYILLGGILLIVSNYIIHKDYVFRLPFPVHEFFVFNKSGILIHSQKVKTTHLAALDPTEHLLISGVMTAITGLVKKILGENSHLNYIDADSHYILFSEIPKVKGLVALITSGQNKLLHKSLDRFTLSFSDDVLNKISRFSDRDQNLNDELNKILLKAFPYLEIL